MHGTTVTDAFRENLENQPFSGITLKYNTVRVYPRFKHFVFVEGNSDMRFYGKTKYSELSEGVYMQILVKESEGKMLSGRLMKR